MVDVAPAELMGLLERGWRRFGPVYFRPACGACHECVSLRLPVASFHASASQRRARQKASRLTRVVGSPEVDAERLALYERWHVDRKAHRGWESSDMSADRYASEFAFPHPCVREVSFRDPERAGALVGVGIVDAVPNALSAVYFFWDPEHAPPSLGVAHVVLLIESAAARGLDYVYLGYRVAGCPSLAYKARYQPHQVLDGRPGDLEAPRWRFPMQDAYPSPSSEASG